MFFNNSKKSFKNNFKLIDEKISFEKNDVLFFLTLDEFIKLIKNSGYTKSLSVAHTIHECLFNFFLTKDKTFLTNARDAFIRSGDIDIINHLDSAYYADKIALIELTNVFADLFVSKYPKIASFSTSSLADFFNNKNKDISKIETFSIEDGFFNKTRVQNMNYIFEDMSEFTMSFDLVSYVNKRGGLTMQETPSEYNPQLNYADNFNHFIIWEGLHCYFKETPVIIESEDKKYSISLKIGDYLKKEPSHSFELNINVNSSSISYLSYQEARDGMLVFQLNVVNYIDDVIDDQTMSDFFENLLK